MIQVKPKTFKIAFLLSANGTTLENLLQKIHSSYLNAQIVLVISSQTNANGIQNAMNANIPYRIIPYQNYSLNLQAYSQAITSILNSYPIDLVVLGGFMSYYKVPDHYLGKIINVHPSLIPSFCGKGFYGIKVHQAVLDYGAKITGCTVHFVDKQYDHGPIISQTCVPVAHNDTPFSLSNKVKEKEHQLYPLVIKAFSENRIHLNGRKVFISN